LQTGIDDRLGGPVLGREASLHVARTAPPDAPLFQRPTERTAEAPALGLRDRHRVDVSIHDQGAASVLPAQRTHQVVTSWCRLPQIELAADPLQELRDTFVTARLAPEDLSRIDSWVVGIHALDADELGAGRGNGLAVVVQVLEDGLLALAAHAKLSPAGTQL